MHSPVCVVAKCCADNAPLIWSCCTSGCTASHVVAYSPQSHRCTPSLVETINSPFMTNKAPCMHCIQIRINNCSWSFERSRRDSKRLRMKFKWFTISSIGRYRHIQLCRRVYAANVNSHGARKLHFRSGVLHDLRLNIVALLA
jgi:hypothetical protein